MATQPLDEHPVKMPFPAARNDDELRRYMGRSTMPFDLTYGRALQFSIYLKNLLASDPAAKYVRLDRYTADEDPKSHVFWRIGNGGVSEWNDKSIQVEQTSPWL
jgi:hypothetical protein